MNHYYRQVIISIKKQLTVDFRSDCSECIDRWVSIFVYFFCIKMNIPAVSRESGAPMWVCA